MFNLLTALPPTLRRNSEEGILMEKDNFRCVECSFPVKTLYIQYSPGNIRLNKCENCKRVADGYIECELMIIVIDLILHKPEAYRHLFYNISGRNSLVGFEDFLWGWIFGFLALDAYGVWVLSSSVTEWSSLMSFASILWSYAKILIGAVLGNILFMSVILISSTKFLNSSALGLRCKHIVLAILVSSYFKIFLVATMVWEFPSSVIFLIDMFVLSSNTVALKVLGNSTTLRCLGFCFAAHAVKFAVTQGLKILY